MAAKGVSKRELARILGVSDTAVRKAIRTGRIELLADGSIDPEAARAAWHRNTDPARAALAEPERDAPLAAPPIRNRDEARDALSLIKQVLQEEGDENVHGPVDFGKARTADMILRARDRAMNLATRRGELVEIEAVGAAVEAAFERCRARLMAIPGNLAQALTNEPNAHVVRDRIFAEVAEALNELSVDLHPGAGAADGAPGPGEAPGA